MVRKTSLSLFFIFSLSASLCAGEVKTDAPFLKLEAGVNGKDSLYPGQKTWLFYRYYFKGNIALTLEELPLLEARGLIKIGEKEFKDYAEGTTSISEISQQVEAVKPGSFSFGPSRIEGYARQEDSLGNTVPSAEKLASEAPPVVITVLPFPEKDQPASFNGAVGTFTFNASLKSPLKMAIGDDISLRLEISGKGNLKNIVAPDLCCQPGFSGFFSFSDLPPAEEIEGDVKKILVMLRPLNSLVEAIPAIEFSFFNPETAAYTTLQSQPIPISVAAPSFESAESNKGGKQSLKETIPSSSIAAEQNMQAIAELEGPFPLNREDLHHKLFGSWWSLAILPVGLFLLFYQKLFKEDLIWQRKHQPAATSKELLLRSFSKGKKGVCDFNLLKRAAKLALVEAGILASADIPDKQLPDEGLSGEVKMFCALLDEGRFSGKKACDIAEIKVLSQSLINRINLACACFNGFHPPPN